MAVSRPLTLFLVVLLLTSLPPAAEGLRFSQWGTLVSLSHSLLTRVANARAARDDLTGADRLRKIADKLSLLGGGIWSLGRDFAWNYAWRGGGVPTAEISRATSRLLEALAEASRIESAAERRRWALRNHRHLVDLADSLFKSLLRTFSQSGPLREMVLALQREVAEGELLKDCLEIVAADLEGLIRIARDAFLSSSNVDEGEL
ncbi:GDSL esterase lipase [Musa troglodytarum]|uniref:GDSL esterase lipase n=1 Tax=Musa troglodytarum TaxID=320322 RepID=A0A9E7L567_9LILI|nr:GDSL esterase lipase [Musa troglodytarum]